VKRSGAATPKDRIKTSGFYKKNIGGKSREEVAEAAKGLRKLAFCNLKIKKNFLLS